jgi:hypothetical protein
MAGEVRDDNVETFLVLSRRCKSVAGAQDDLARAVSVLAIRMMEEAAEAGVVSPKRAKLAERIIAKVRDVLRRPTWWEPRRCYSPPAAPGNAR